MKIIWSPLAITRVNEIADYIAEDSPEAAKKWVDEIFNKIERIEKFPLSGRLLPEMDRKIFARLGPDDSALFLVYRQFEFSFQLARHAAHHSRGCAFILYKDQSHRRITHRYIKYETWDK